MKQEETKEMAIVEEVASEKIVTDKAPKKVVKPKVVDVNFMIVDEAATDDELERTRKKSVPFDKQRFIQVLATLPQSISGHLLSIQSSLESADCCKAFAQLELIVAELKSERYANVAPINITHENKLWHQSRPEKDKIKSFLKTTRGDQTQPEETLEQLAAPIIRTIQMAQSGQAISNKRISRRLQPRKTISQCLLDGSPINIQAVTSAFVLNAGPKMPVKVTCEFLRMSVDLGCFPVVEPSYEPGIAIDVQQQLRLLVAVQNELLCNNWHQFDKNLLHILAEGKNLAKSQVELLHSFLKQDSFQSINLLQSDSEQRTPLLVAFESCNSDFIVEVLNSEISKSLDFWQLHESFKSMVTCFDTFFVPPPLSQLAKKRQAKDNFQIRVLNALHDHLSRRKDLSSLLSDLKDKNARVLRGLDRYGQLTDKQFVYEMDSSQYFESVSCYKDQKWLCDCLVLPQVKAMPEHEQFLIALFGQVFSQFGFPLIQMAAWTPLHELQTLFATSPGIAFLMKNQVSVASEYNNKASNLGAIMAQLKMLDDYRFSAMKLAVLYQPEDVNMHHFFADAIDLELLSPDAHFETLVYAGEALGTQTRLFTVLFQSEPWKHECPLLFTNQKLTNEKTDHLLKRLGRVLIDNHDQEKFHVLMLTLKDRFVQEQTLTGWVYYCISKLAPACLVSLFALFPTRFELQKQAGGKPFGFNFDPRQPIKPHLAAVKISKEQIGLAGSFDSAIIRNLKAKEPLSNTSLFFDALRDSHLTNDFVKFIMKHNLLDLHFGEIDTEQLSKHMHRKTDHISAKRLAAMGKSITDRFRFFTNVMKYCSVQTTTDFLQSQLSARNRFGNFTGLLPYFVINSLTEAAHFDSEQPPTGVNRQPETKAYQQNFKRRAELLLPKMLENAICFPQQVQLLKESQKDGQLAQDLADRLGVGTKEFNLRCKEVLKQIDSKPVQEFGLDQLHPGMASAHNQMEQTIPSDHSKVAKTVAPSIFNVFFAKIMDQKLSASLEMLKTLISRAEPLQLLNYIAWLRYDNRDFETNYYLSNLFAFAQPGKNYSWYNRENEGSFNAFLLTARLQLYIIGQLLTPDCIKSIQAFPDEVFLLQRDDSKSILDCLQKHQLSLKFFEVQQHFVERVHTIMLVRKGTNFATFTCQRLLGDFYQIIGDNLVDLMKLDLAVEKLKTRHENDDYEERSVAQTVEKITTNFYSQFCGPVQGKPAQNYWRNNMEAVKFLCPAKIDPIRQIFDPIMAVIARNFSQIMTLVEFISQNTTDEVKEVENFQRLVAVWFSLMTPEQLDQVLEQPCFPFQCTQLNLTCLLTRKDVSKAILLKLIGQLSQSDFQLQEKTQTIRSTKIHEVIADLTAAAKILHLLISDGIIFSDRLKFDELPETLKESADASHLIAAIASPCQNERKTAFILDLLTKLDDAFQFLHLCPKTFTFVTTHLQRKKDVMDAVFAWIKTKQGISALEHELASPEPEDKETSEDGSIQIKPEQTVQLVCDLMAQQKFETIYLVKEHATPELWEQLINQRTLAANSNSFKFRPDVILECDFDWDDEMDADYSAAENERSAEIEEFAKQDLIRPFFMALNQARFDMCKLLQPAEFGDLTLCEYSSLLAVFSQGICPLILEPNQKLAQLQEKISSITAEQIQSFGCLQLLTALPDAMKLIKHASAREPQIIQTLKNVLKRGHEQVDQQLKDNCLARMILEEASQSVQVLHYMISIGLLSGPSLFKDIFTLHLKQSHVDAAKCFFDLLAAFPIAGFPSQPMEKINLAAVVGIEGHEAYDSIAAFKELLYEYSHDFLQAAGKADLSEFVSFETYQSRLNELNSEQRIDNDEEYGEEEIAYTNYENFVLRMKKEKKQMRKKLMESVANLTLITNIFASKAQDAEQFIQHYRATVDSHDRTAYWSLPREVWMGKFKANTTNDMSQLALAWIELLSHFQIPFGEVLSTDLSKAEFLKLMVGLRTDSFEKAVPIVDKMIKYAGDSIQLLVGVQEVVPGLNLTEETEAAKIFIKVNDNEYDIYDSVDFTKTRHLCAFFKVVFKLGVMRNGHKISKEEAVGIMLKPLINGGGFARAIKVLKALEMQQMDEPLLTNQQQKEINESCAISAMMVVIPIVSEYHKLDIFLGQFKCTSISQLINMLKILETLRHQFTGKTTKTIKISNELDIGMSFKITAAQESETMLVNSQVLTDPSMKQWLQFDLKGQYQARQQALEFLGEMTKRSEKACGFGFASIELAAVDENVDFPPREKWEEAFDFLEGLSNIKPRRISQETTDAIYLSDKYIERLSKSTLNVTFVTAGTYQRDEVFKNVLAKYSDEADTLIYEEIRNTLNASKEIPRMFTGMNFDLVLSVDDGQVSVCADSYLPNLHKTLKGHEATYQNGKLEVKIDYSGLCKKLASLSAKVDLEMLASMGKRRIKSETGDGLQQQLDACFDQIEFEVQTFNRQIDQGPGAIVVVFESPNDAVFHVQESQKLEIIEVRKNLVKKSDKTFEKYKNEIKKVPESLAIITVVLI